MYTSAGHTNYNISTFTWDLIDVCQYRCTYCYALPWLVKKLDVKKTQTYKSILKRLRIIQTDKFKIEILGGEPTLHPNLRDIILDLSHNRRCIEININTNFTKPVDYFAELVQGAASQIRVLVSLHVEYVTCIDTLLNKLQQLAKLHGIEAHLNINLHKDKKYIETYKTCLSFCKVNGISVGVNYLNSTDNYESKYSEEVLDEIKEYTHTDLEKIPYITTTKEVEYYNLHEIVEKKLNKFHGSLCKAKMWTITNTGEIINTCTREPLALTSSNIDNYKECPLKCCGCDEMLKYHKKGIK